MAGPKVKVDVNKYLADEQAKSGNPDFWTTVEDLYNKKLWHQITLKLYDFVRLPDASAVDLVGLYNNFISDFESRMNPLTLIEIVAFIIKQMNDYDECVEFLRKMKEKVKMNQQASLLVMILIGQIKLIQKDVKEVKVILEEIGPIIEDESIVTPIHGRYFQLSSDYHQLMGHHQEYYRDALRYLGCEPTWTEADDLVEKKAFTLSLAALLGETIFNFGELLQHDIVNYLRGSNAWVKDLLYAFNAGDLSKYEALRSHWASQPDLAAHEIQLRQKISLLCLMEMTFKSSNGRLTFGEISGKTHLPLHEIELLVMKALSLGLVKGTIDQVEQVVHLTWVQPRVLDKNQIGSMRSKLDNWLKNVNTMESLLEKKAEDIIDLKY